MDDNNIDILNLPVHIKDKLLENNILDIEDLWALKRNDLKNLGFSNDDIKRIIIQLQLLGLDLSKKKVK